MSETETKIINELLSVIEDLRKDAEPKEHELAVLREGLKVMECGHARKYLYWPKSVETCALCALATVDQYGGPEDVRKMSVFNYQMRFLLGDIRDFIIGFPGGEKLIKAIDDIRSKQ